MDAKTRLDKLHAAFDKSCNSDRHEYMAQLAMAIVATEMAVAADERDARERDDRQVVAFTLAEECERIARDAGVDLGPVDPDATARMRAVAACDALVAELRDAQAARAAKRKGGKAEERQASAERILASLSGHLTVRTPEERAQALALVLSALDAP